MLIKKSFHRTLKKPGTSWPKRSRHFAMRSPSKKPMTGSSRTTRQSRYFPFKNAFGFWLFKIEKPYLTILPLQQDQRDELDALVTELNKDKQLLELQIGNILKVTTLICLYLLSQTYYYHKLTLMCLCRINKSSSKTKKTSRYSSIPLR